MDPLSKTNKKTHFFSSAYRTHHCGALSEEDIGKEVVLCGWVQRERRMGGIVFIDLRDRYGTTQLVYEISEKDKARLEADPEALMWPRQALLFVKGKVVRRESPNPKMPTGQIEVRVGKEFLRKYLSKSDLPPFLIEDETDALEDLRLQYRYLDLRRRPLQRNLLLRHQVYQTIRHYLNAREFVEIETPMLVRSTPEGARDFMVEAGKNQYYALPQSPQIFKQLLMVGGYDRYYQIARCFRDEDMRADRQPEFTQLDCEMSFVSQTDLMKTFEGLINTLFKDLKGIQLGSFPRLTYEKAMRHYGTDKPDLRFGLKATDLTRFVKGYGFQPFDEASHVVWAMGVEGQAGYSRKQLDALTDFVRSQQVGGQGLVYVKLGEGESKSSVSKYYDHEQVGKWIDKMVKRHPDEKIPGAGDLLLLVYGDKKQVPHVYSSLRLHLADQLGWRKEGAWKPVWITDFPLFERDKEGKLTSLHHPFTEPTDEALDYLKEAISCSSEDEWAQRRAQFEQDALKVSASAYDLVVNGVELGGGSLRITDRALQKIIFRLLGLTDTEAQTQFGFLMEAFQYGPPPHGGIAFGLDRLCMLLAGAESIRDVIAFPKNSAGRDRLMRAPAPKKET